ncbi:hypothetical protein HOK68_02770 [Candidatus Woesearchaeota archaeon]|jgi:hypothetical protein|nr:hypothetical protein [Candidatus Woesearchaeota archaeon]MBT4387120.1 hypothetical protein [Candidatus Woesearchaeota archaeon]MBT4596123.1 hypothetical protein [Candidatus Woesearchaeota archaeon]MBT5741654.1 hypothetical protein [Candidatus Woesearchaeota archaeon]MBT6505675.1 hypothetical protein [Candidatus Woesearchaeota archaeon]
MKRGRFSLSLFLSSLFLFTLMPFVSAAEEGFSDFLMSFISGSGDVIETLIAIPGLMIGLTIVILSIFFYFVLYLIAQITFLHHFDHPEKIKSIKALIGAFSFLLVGGIFILGKTNIIDIESTLTKFSLGSLSFVLFGVVLVMIISMVKSLRSSLVEKHPENHISNFFLYIFGPLAIGNLIFTTMFEFLKSLIEIKDFTLNPLVEYMASGTLFNIFVSFIVLGLVFTFFSNKKNQSTSYFKDFITDAETTLKTRFGETGGSKVASEENNVMIHDSSKAFDLSSLNIPLPRNLPSNVETAIEQNINSKGEEEINELVQTEKVFEHKVITYVESLKKEVKFIYENYNDLKDVINQSAKDLKFSFDALVEHDPHLNDVLKTNFESSYGNVKKEIDVFNSNRLAFNQNSLNLIESNLTKIESTLKNSEEKVIASKNDKHLLVKEIINEDKTLIEFFDLIVKDVNYLNKEYHDIANLKESFIKLSDRLIKMLETAKGNSDASEKEVIDHLIKEISNYKLVIRSKVHSLDVSVKNIRKIHF